MIEKNSMTDLPLNYNLQTKNVMIADVYFNYKQKKDWDNRVPTEERQVNMVYLDFWRKAYQKVLLSDLKKDIIFEKMTETEIASYLKGRYINITITIL